MKADCRLWTAGFDNSTHTWKNLACCQKELGHKNIFLKNAFFVLLKEQSSWSTGMQNMTLVSGQSIAEGWCVSVRQVLQAPKKMTFLLRFAEG